ncbi:MAG: hypothetical protein MJA83_06870 [Gammaproteobacteria bacterium]|nr:hypothetical protein [Gammaproteobacteria bacterium]
MQKSRQNIVLLITGGAFETMGILSIVLNFLGLIPAEIIQLSDDVILTGTHLGVVLLVIGIGLQLKWILGLTKQRPDSVS